MADISNNSIGSRHVPGSQPLFSLIPDSGQNKEDTSFISAAAYGVYILISSRIKVCLLPNQNFEKNAQDAADLAEPWFQDLIWFLPISWGSNNFIKEIPCISIAPGQ